MTGAASFSPGWRMFACCSPVQGLQEVEEEEHGPEGEAGEGDEREGDEGEGYWGQEGGG